MVSRKTILFVHGFDTVSSKEYLLLDLLLSKTYIFTYFAYGPNEALLDVYQRLLDTIDTDKPDILIGHNVGGGLLVKYVKSDQYKNEKTLLLMPFLCRNPILDSISNFLTFYKIFDPKLMFPKDSSLVSFRQPYDMYMDKAIQLNDVLAFMKYKSNVTIFYAEDERLNIIDKTTLQQILPTCRLINGYWHSNNTDFFIRIYDRLTSRLSYLRNTVYIIMKKEGRLTKNAALYLIYRFQSAVHMATKPSQSRTSSSNNISSKPSYP